MPETIKEKKPLLKLKPPWWDDMKFCHIGKFDSNGKLALCGHKFSENKFHGGTYQGEAICPVCGEPTCPRCAQLHALEERL